MPAISRISDKTAGHCFPPHSPDSGLTSSVFVNGQAVIVLGTHFPTHVCGTSSHDATQTVGSSSVFFEGKAVARIGDSQNCGDQLAQGSPNVFAG